MRRLLLITLLSLLTTSIFCAGYTQYNGTGSPSSLPSLVVELRSEGHTLGFGFSSTNPESEGITNITEMPLSLSSKFDSDTGKITLIGSTSFYIWWQIQMPIEGGTAYSFSVSKSGDLSGGGKNIPYTANLMVDSSTKIEISTVSKELDTYSKYDKNSIHSASYLVEINTRDASGVPYGTILSSSIVLEVKTKI